MTLRMVILGLGGKKYSKDHIKGTAEVISACSPNYVGALTLYLENRINKNLSTSTKGNLPKLMMMNL